MAAGTLSKPGTDFGPCETDCKHRDCQQTRDMATKSCGICSEPIGYDRRFYRDNETTPPKYHHALCLEEKFANEANT